MPPRIIAISGIDGSGKSTCAEMIKEILESNNEKTVILDAMKNGIFVNTAKNNTYQNTDILRKKYSPEMINLMWVSDLIFNYEIKVKKYIMEGTNVILHRSDLCCRVYSKVFSPHSTMVDAVLNSYNFNYDIQLYVKTLPNLVVNRINRRTMGYEKTIKESTLLLNRAYELYDYYLQLPMYKNIGIIDGTLTVSAIKARLEDILYK